MLHLTLADKEPVDKAYKLGNFFDYNQAVEQEYDDNFAGQNSYV